MFEKEAVERYKQHLADPNYYENSEEESYLRGFREGAEFAYNKANEWHYVKDGDLPKDENKIWIYFGDDDYNCGQFIQGRFWCYSCGWFDIEDVIAWKELIPPMES